MSDVGNLEYGGRGKDAFQFIESGLLKGGPLPRFSLLGEKIQWGDNVREVRNEFPVEVHESHEGSDSFHGRRGLPLLDRFEFLLVHLYFSLPYDQA